MKRAQDPVSYTCHKYRTYPAWGFDGVYVSKNDAYAYTLDKNLLGLKESPFQKIKAKYLKEDNTPVYELMNFREEKVLIDGDRLCMWTFYGPLMAPIKRRFKDYNLNDGTDFRYDLQEPPINIKPDIISLYGTEFKKFQPMDNIEVDAYISKSGTVCSITQNYGIIIKAHLFQHNLYHRVGFSRLGNGGELQHKHWAIHRAVYTAWIAPLADGIQINHLDGRKWHNSLSNLEPTTSLENMHHAIRNHLREAPYQEDDIREICGYLQQGNISPREIARLTGRPYESIRAIVKALVAGRTWPHVTKAYDFTEYRNTYHRYEIPPETIHQLCKMWESRQYSREQICEQLKLPKTVVNAIINGYSRRDISSQYNMRREEQRGYFTDEELHSVCRDLMEMDSVAEVAKKYHRSDAGIRGILSRRIRPDITCQYHFELKYPKLTYCHSYGSTTIERVS